MLAVMHSISFACSISNAKQTINFGVAFALVWRFRPD